MRAVIPSVHYADFLAVTLPAWQAILPSESLTVVTSSEDADTQAVADRNGVQCLVTDVWFEGGKTFNKASALDEAFGLAGDTIPPPNFNELCLALDADSFPCGTWPRESTIEPGVIYGCGRYHCETPAALEAHRRGRTRRLDLELIPSKVRGSSYGSMPHSDDNLRSTAEKCLGYFQLWRHDGQKRFGASQTAGGYDLKFRDQFNRRSFLPGFYVLHLGPQDRNNWKGRTLPRWGSTA